MRELGPEIEHRQDGTASSPILHMSRKHLGHLPRSYGSVVATSGLTMSIPMNSKLTRVSSPKASQGGRLSEIDPDRLETLNATYDDWTKLDQGAAHYAVPLSLCLSLFKDSG